MELGPLFDFELMPHCIPSHEIILIRSILVWFTHSLSNSIFFQIDDSVEIWRAD